MKSRLLLVLMFILASACSENNDSKLSQIVNILPEISPYMIKPDSSGPAIWLDRKQADGRFIQEPINLILVDQSATSITDAEQRLINVFQAAGFGSRYGHTSGYLGIMNNVIYPQTPAIKDHTFSDYMWAFSNNHTRVFGPFVNGASYIWIASSSREKGISHDYISFRASRDSIIDAMDRYSNVEIIGSFMLHNKIDNQSVTTGDHDGYAKIVLIK